MRENEKGLCLSFSSSKFSTQVGSLSFSFGFLKVKLEALSEENIHKCRSGILPPPPPAACFSKAKTRATGLHLFARNPKVKMPI